MRSRRIGIALVRLSVSGPVSFGDPQRELVQTRMRRALADAKGDEMLVDVPIATDPSGQAIVRGTSVFGALRSHLASYLVRDTKDLRFRPIDSVLGGASTTRPCSLADLLCGSEPEELNSQGKPSLRPSALRLVAAELTDGKPSEGTARTAVSRRHGSAEARKLFRRAQLEGARIELLLQVDLSILDASCATIAPQVKAADAAADLVTALQQWQPLLGGRVGTGWGRAHVDDIEWGVKDPLDLTSLLAGSTTIEVFRGIAKALPNSPRELLTCLAPSSTSMWNVDAALACGDFLLLDPRQQPTAQRNNRAVTSDRVTGSTWRGLLRSRSEFILRTCGVFACLSSEGEEICGECPTCTLFGWAPGPRSRATGVGSRGLIGFADSVVMGDRVTLDHGPVDRFTGGAADGKLFTRESWALGSTLTLSIYQLSPHRPVPEWGKDLVVMAIRDVASGFVGVGNSTTRGYGTVHLQEGEALPGVPDNWLESVPGAQAEVTS